MGDEEAVGAEGFVSGPWVGLIAWGAALRYVSGG